MFTDVQTIKNLIERTFFEQTGVEFDWIERQNAGRWATIWSNEGLTVIKVPRTYDRLYTCLEIKGHGAQVYGNDALFGLLANLATSGLEWRATRVDFAWNNPGFTVAQVLRAAIRGDVRTRLDVEEGHFHKPIKGVGATVEWPRRALSRPRRFRVYDVRGYVRFELELHDEWATTLCKLLAVNNPWAWPSLCMANVRGLVDFVDRRSSTRIERCKLIDWWEAFTKHEPKVKGHGLGASVIDDASAEWVNRLIWRNARSMERLRRAFGDRWLLERLRREARRRWTLEDDAAVRKLQRLSGSERIQHDRDIHFGEGDLSMQEAPF